MIGDEKFLELEFQHFFLDNFPKVKTFAKLLLKSEIDAEDLAQDVFLKLWSHPEIWHDKTKELDNYLFIMTKNMVLNSFKHQKVEDEYQNDLFSNEQLIELSEREDVLDHVFYKEMLLALRLTLERMPERRRTIFEMSRFKGMSNKEIAEKLDLSVRTVEHQVYLALTELKKILLFLIFL